MLPEDIKAYLQAHRREHLEAFFELLRFPSVANLGGPDDPCRRCSQWLAERLSACGLSTEIFPTEGKPCIVGHVHVADDLPTVLIYGHYDVQPPDPLEAWQSDPFDPVVRDNFVYARGASDDKGQLFTHLMALEAWRSVVGHPPVNVKVLLEGEEEIGSPHLDPFVAANAERLSADAAVFSDAEFFAPDLPSITYAVRGLVYLELTVRGPSEDLHSGLHGGAVVNPLNALATMIARMHDGLGRVTIPGFYDDVASLSDEERKAWKTLPFDAEQYASSLGVSSAAGGERNYSVLERRWARPTLDCHGIVGGYVEPGAKTVIPSHAAAKLSMRLVPHQRPEDIVEGFRYFVSSQTPEGTQAEISVQAMTRSLLLAPELPVIAAVREALYEAFGRPPAMIRCGGSLPILESIRRVLGLDPVLMGFALPGDRVHAPNERFRLDQLWRGSLAAAAILSNLAETWQNTSSAKEVQSGP